MLRLITSPGEFLGERSENLSLRTPAGFVILAGIVFSLEALVANQHLDPAIADELTLAIGVFVVFRFAEQIGAWLLGALVVTAVAKILGGRITYYRSLHAIGWGVPAVVVAGAIQVVGYYIALQNVPQPEVAALENTGIGQTSILQAIDNYTEFVRHRGNHRLFRRRGLRLDERDRTVRNRVRPRRVGGDGRRSGARSGLADYLR